jgi:hypothetical protein
MTSDESCFASQQIQVAMSPSGPFSPVTRRCRKIGCARFGQQADLDPGSGLFVSGDQSGLTSAPI